MTAIARENLLYLEGCAATIDPIFLPAAANRAVDHVALAMRATLRGERRKTAARMIFDHVARADAYIADHLHDTELSVAEIAKSVGISSGYLQQIYRSVTDLSVAQSILERRLAHCREDLADPSLTEESITAISFRWGFSESSSFGRAFRRAFGVSPRRYRKLSRTGKAGLSALDPVARGSR